MTAPVGSMNRSPRARIGTCGCVARSITLRVRGPRSGHVRRHEGNATSAQVPSYAAFPGSRRKVPDKFFSRGDLYAARRRHEIRRLPAPVCIRGKHFGSPSGEWKRALRSFRPGRPRRRQPGGPPRRRIAWFNLVHPILGRRRLGGCDFLRWESNLRLRLRAHGRVSRATLAGRPALGRKPRPTPDLEKAYRAGVPASNRSRSRLKVNRIASAGRGRMGR